MMSFRVKRLSQLTDRQLQELVDCCSKALCDDPAQKALIGGDLTCMDVYMRAMLQATLLEGHLYVVCVGPELEERILSTGSFFAHGKYPFDSEEQRALGYYEYFKKLSPEAQFWLSHTYPEKIKPLDKSLFTPQEVKTRWWCYNLATHPDHQKQGYATAIMNAVFEEVKRSKSFLGVVPATELNVKIYASMSFKEIGGTCLPAPTGDFNIHVMTRGR